MVIRKVKEEFPNMNGDIMEYAEDLVCWSGEVVVSRRLMESFARHLRQVGLSMNTEKTVIMRVGRGEKRCRSSLKVND